MKKLYLIPLFFATLFVAWAWNGDKQRDVEYARTSVERSAAENAVPTNAVSANAVSANAVSASAVSGQSAAAEDLTTPKFAREESLKNVKRVTAEERKEREKERNALAEKKKKAVQKKAAMKKKAQEAKRSYIIKDVPADNEVKKYERYTLLTKWKQADLQKLAHTDNNGMRKVGSRYCVALGSYYTTTIGTEFDLIMENGTVIPCILGDVKSDLHTDAKHQRGKNDGCVAEFIVDDTKLQKNAKISGSVHVIPEFAGEIKEIKIYTD
jgi:hypothetical protein